MSRFERNDLTACLSHIMKFFKRKPKESSNQIVWNVKVTQWIVLPKFEITKEDLTL